MKSLALKLQGKLISIIDLAAKYPQIIGSILIWINEHQKAASPEALTNAIQILRAFSEDEEGRQLECRYGCVEFFSEYRKFAPQFITGDIEALIKALLKTRRNMVIPEPQSIPSSVPVERSAKETIPTLSEKPLTINKKEEVKVVDENCEFPIISLTEAEEKVIFDINVVIRYGDPSAIIKACEDLKGIIEDFPIECLLQRSDLLKNLLYRLEHEKDFPLYRFAIPILMRIVDKLQIAYEIYESKFSRPSELSGTEKFEQKISKTYLEGIYPAVLSGAYEKDQEFINKISVDSMSHLSALRNIARGAVKVMKDKRKLGCVMQLYKKTLNVVKTNYVLTEERITKEFFVPICHSLVDTIQSYNIKELMQDHMINVILHAAINLGEYMNEQTIEACYKVVPKFFSALEEAAYFNVFDDNQIITLRNLTKVYNSNVIASLDKVNNIKQAIMETRKYQEEQKAKVLCNKRLLESKEDLKDALQYLNQLIICLEFYSVQESLLEEVIIIVIKDLIEKNLTAHLDEFIDIFIKIFKSPHTLHRTRLLKAIVLFNCE